MDKQDTLYMFKYANKTFLFLLAHGLLSVSFGDKFRKLDIPGNEHQLLHQVAKTITLHLLTSFLIQYNQIISTAIIKYYLLGL